MNHSHKNRQKRFFTPLVLKPDCKTVTLDKAESHHCRHVLRLKQGDTCLLFDSVGHEWEGKIVSFLEHGETVVELVAAKEKNSVVSCFLTIAQAIPQRAKMDSIIEKATELGVNRVIPMVTGRTIVRIKEEDQAKVMRRWLKIVQEARKQSTSQVSIEISYPMMFEAVLKQAAGATFRWIFHPGSVDSVQTAIENARERLKKNHSAHIFALIGPEGGFNEHELRMAAEQGFRAVRLGDSILKSDTAFLSIASLLKIGI